MNTIAHRSIGVRLLAFLGLLLCAALATLGPVHTTAFAADGSSMPSAVTPGTVVAWGSSYAGLTNVPAALDDAIAIAAGEYHSMALKSDGSVVVWGFSSNQPPAGLGNVVAIAAGNEYSLALKSDGSVVAWGSNANNSLTRVPAGLNNVVALDAGWYNAAALKSDGTVVTWGPVGAAPAGLSGVVDIALGYSHAVALKSDGTVVAWGSSSYGQSNVPAGLSNVVAVATGENHSVAVKSDGGVVTWGQGVRTILDNPPVDLRNVVDLEAGGAHAVALKGDGSVVAWGFDADGQGSVPPAAQRGVAAISVGRDHNLALLAPRSDTTPPAITSDIAGALGDNGWYTGNATVTWTVADPDSEVYVRTGCDPVTINADTAGRTLTCSATSDGGTTSRSVTVKRDATPPTAAANAAPAPNAAGWNAQPVTVSFSGTDTVSGVAGCSPSVTLRADGANQSASGSCTDRAGNASATANATGINIDTTAPETALTAKPNQTSYSNRATFAFSGSDSLSGLAGFECSLDSASYAGCSSPVTLTGLGDGQHMFMLRAVDKAGNRDGTGASHTWTVRNDVTPPAASPEQTPAANEAGWNNDDVVIAWNWTDGGAGIDAANCTSGSTSSGEGTLQLEATCKDLEGNTGSAIYTVYVDKTAPTLSPAVSPNPVKQGAVASVDAGAADALSGIASAGCDTPDTTTLGDKTVNCSVTDYAGNGATASAAYTVIPASAPPSVTIAAPSGTTPSSVNLAGTVNANGATTTSLAFQYGTTSGRYTRAVSTTPTRASGETATNVRSKLAGLQPNTIYFVRLVATNAAGTSASSEIAVRTAAQVLDFNLFTFGATSLNGGSGSVAGTIGAGGNLVTNRFDLGTGVQVPADSVLVNGNLTLANGRVTGNAVYGDTLTQRSGVTFVGGAPIKRAGALEIANTRRYARQVAAAWAALPAGGTTSFEGGALVLSGNDGDENIFSVRGEQLAQATSLQVNAPAGTTVIVNVDGTTNRLTNLSLRLSGVDRRHVVFNFYATSSLDITSSTVEGLIWAPDAAITFNAATLNGSLLALKLSGSSLTATNATYLGSLPR